MRSSISDYQEKSTDFLTDFAPAEAKFSRKHKYEKKLLALIAMSPRGISEPFIMASENALDQFV